MSLKPDTLSELRDIVHRLHASEGPMPFSDLVTLGSHDELNQRGITIDVAASKTLGVPLVVLHSQGDPPRIEGLTRRESEVAKLIAMGLTNKQIAERLTVSVPTVKDHVHNILAKTGLPSRAAVASRCRVS